MGQVLQCNLLIGEGKAVLGSGNKMFRIRVNGIVVRVRFSEERSVDVKYKIRDILTEAY